MLLYRNPLPRTGMTSRTWRPALRYTRGSADTPSCLTVTLPYRTPSLRHLPTFSLVHLPLYDFGPLPILPSPCIGITPRWTEVRSTDGSVVRVTLLNTAVLAGGETTFFYFRVLPRYNLRPFVGNQCVRAERRTQCCQRYSGSRGQCYEPRAGSSHGAFRNPQFACVYALMSALYCTS